MTKEMVWDLVEIGVFGYKQISQKEFEEGTRNKKPNLHYFYNKTLNGVNLQYVEVYTEGSSNEDILLKLQIKQYELLIAQNKLQDRLLKLQETQNKMVYRIKEMVKFFVFLTIVAIILAIIAGVNISDEISHLSRYL